MKISDLLKTNASSFKAPQKFPAGNYVVVIVSYDTLPFFWKKSGVHGLAYVPTIRPISCIEADDDSNPDLQAEQLDALQDYGDWTARELQFAYTSRETNAKMAAVSEINFPLIECNKAGEPVGILEKHAWRFYLRGNDGTEQGFVADVLGLSYPDGEELGTIMEDTVGKKFLVTFAYEANPNDPSRPPNLVIESVTQV
jgi:hypothetical protein